MVQEFHVLKCYSCELFQVHIVKKVNKWACKVCGTKQSVIKVFGQGSAKDCRLCVQQLNDHSDVNVAKKFINDEQLPANEDTEENNYSDFPVEVNIEEQTQDLMSFPEKSTSKWQKYVQSKEIVKKEGVCLKRSLEFNGPQTLDIVSSTDEDEFPDETNVAECCDYNISDSRNTNRMEMQSHRDKMFKFSADDDSDIDSILNL